MSQVNTSFYRVLSRLISRPIRVFLPLLAPAFALTMFACADKEVEDPDNETGKIVFEFIHTINNEPLIFDTLQYVNAAGNPYMVNEIQYFISDVRLVTKEGSVQLINGWKDIHYVDTDIQASQTWEVYDNIDPGNYDSLVFTFGISEEKNSSFMYVNPPEKDMFWPEFLGGGYHYMKLNGKWLPEDQTMQTQPFDFHLGIGQIYYSYPDSITSYVHNNFDVSLPTGECVVKAGVVAVLQVNMHVEKWFEDPHIYNHDLYGGYIMQNQDAMEEVRENGHNVFTVEVIEHEQ